MANEQTQHPAHTSVKGYLLVFLGLAVLTGATVALSYLGLPHGVAITGACLLALAKCLLIATFFMHLRTENKGIWLMIGFGVFLIGALIFSLIPDIGFVD